MNGAADGMAVGLNGCHLENKCPLKLINLVKLGRNERKFKYLLIFLNPYRPYSNIYEDRDRDQCCT